MMDLEFSETQRAARDTARRFARERLTAVGVEVDRNHSFPPRRSPNWDGSA